MARRRRARFVHDFVIRFQHLTEKVAELVEVHFAVVVQIQNLEQS